MILLLLVAFSVLWRGGKSVDATWILAGVACVMTLCIWWRNRRETAVQLPPSVWLSGFAFVLWTVVSFLTSKTQNYGLDEVLRDGALFLIFVTVARTPPSATLDLWRRFAATIGITAAIACLVGIAVYALQPVDRFVGTFFDARFHTDYWPNAWAEFLLLAWPMTLLLGLQAKTPARRLGWIAILGLLLGSLLLSYSRGAVLVFSAQTILLGVVWSMGKSSVPPTRSAGAFALAALLALLLFSGVNRLRTSQFSVLSAGDKVTFTATEGTSSINERSAFWRQSLLFSVQRPVFGWGPYSFRFVQPRLAEGVLQTSDHPHNVFLKLLVERGVPGVLLYMLFLASVFLPAMRRLLLRKENGFLFFGLVAAIGVFAHNLIDYNLQFVGIALPLWILLGLLQAGGTRPSPVPQRTFESALAGALLVVTIVEGVFLGLSSLGRRAEARGDFPAAIQWYEAAEHEIFRRDMDLSRSNILINQKLFEKGSIALDDYEKNNAQDARLWEMRARLLDAEGKSEQALETLDLAYMLGKWTNAGILHGLLAIHEKTNRALTVEEFEEYLSVVKAYAEAVQRNAHFIALSMNVEELMAAASLLSRLCPLTMEECDRRTAELDLRTAAADRNARAEREKFTARPSGYLW